MASLTWLGASLIALAAVYLMWLVTLAVAGRGGRARAIAGFLPDCAVLITRLVRRPGTPRHRRLVLLLVAGYLASPIDLVPDFLPVIGYLDDAVVVLVTLRWLLRAVGAEAVTAAWPGPDSSLRVVLRLADGER